MALRGIEFLRRADDILCETPRPTGGRLAEAMHALWTASLDYGYWPAGFRKRADEVRRLIFEAGTIRETAAGMGEAAFADLKEKVRSLAQDAEAGRRPGD